MANRFEEGKPITFTLGPDIRFMWPYVFEKRPNEQGEPKYEVVIQIPYENKKMVDLFEEATDEAIARGYSGAQGEKWTFKKGTKESALKTPLKDGEDKIDNEEYGHLFKGYMFATAKSSKRPTVLDANMQQILDPDEFRSGATGAVSVTLMPYNTSGAQGVTCYLNHIMQLKESDLEVGGRVDPEVAFAEYKGRGAARGGERSRGESRSRSREDDAPARRSSRSRDGSDDAMFD